MSMLSSMYSGVAGLNVHGKGMSSVADNIANVSTHGYKATRCNFGDVMVQSLTVGGSVVNQVGSGARVLNVQQLLTQGSFEATEIPTDMAINGRGFFKVRRSTTVTAFGNLQETGAMNMNTGPSYYTRAGQFIMDKEGFLVNPMGLRLQGYNINTQGNLTLIPEDLRILTQQSDAISTTEIQCSLNLDAEDMNYHVPTEAIVPTDQNTYNYMTTVRTYDALGVAHDLAMVYQRLEPDSYNGSTPTSSERVWKVGVFEKIGDDFVTTNLTQGTTGTFYLHFDDYGHLVGNSTGQPAAGDSWTTQSPLPLGGSPISSRAGETFSYNVDPNNDQSANLTFRSKLNLDMTAWDQMGDTLTLNGRSYRYEDYPDLADLANEINRTSGNNGVFCNQTGNTIEVYTNGSTTATATFTNSGTGNLTAAGTTADEFLNAVNTTGDPRLRTARGGLYVNTFPIPAGENITIGTTNIAIGGLADVNAVVAAINAVQGATNVQATAVGDGSIYLEATTPGAAYNHPISLTGSPTVTGTASMAGGMDAHPANVEMIQDPDGNFILRRTDSGAGAIINVATGNTLANGALNMRKLSFAMDQEVPSSLHSDEGGPSGKGVREISFDWLDATGAHQSQPITLDFIPTVSSPTTQSAGSSEIFYLFQDGSPRGNLQSLDIGRDGLVTGNFSNGTSKMLGAVLLYNFASPEHLKREGENLWSSTLQAGPEVAGRPGQASLGYVESGALEQSNVDLANEFVKMINYQRAFQANSKTISTTDEMLAELINLKR